MKRIAMILLIAMLCTGCSNSELDSIQAELNDVTAKYEQLRKEHDALQADYADLKKELEEVTPELDLNPAMEAFTPDYQSIYTGEPIVINAQAGDNTQIELGTTLVLPYVEVTVSECGMAEAIPYNVGSGIYCYYGAGVSNTMSYLKLSIQNTTDKPIYPCNRVWVSAQYDGVGGVAGYGSLVKENQEGDNPLAIQPQETTIWYAACPCSYETRDNLTTCTITIGFPDDIHVSEGLVEGGSAYQYHLSFNPVRKPTV